MILRELFAKVGLDVDAQSFAKGALAVEAVKFGLTKLVDAAAEVVHQFADNVRETIEYTGKLDDQAQALGVTAERLQELEYASLQNGLQQEELTAGLVKLTATMKAAAGGAEAQAAAFHTAGVKVKNTDGTLRDSADVLEDLADHFESLPDGADKTALSMELLGKTGSRMIPLLNAGGQGIRDLAQEARDLGLVIQEKSVKAGADLGDEIDRLHAQTRGLWRSAIGPLLPMMTDLVKELVAWRKANADVIRQRLQVVIGAVVKAAAALGRGLRVVFDVIEGLVGGLKLVVGWLIAFGREHKTLTALLIAGVLAYETIVHWAAIRTALAWAASLAPLLAIAAAIGAVLLLVNSWKRWKEGKDSIFGDWMQALDEWLKPAKNQPWWLTAIKDFVKLIRQAIDAIDELTGDAERKRLERLAEKSPKQMQAEIDASNMKVARMRAAKGLPLTDAERASLARNNVPEQAFVERYRRKPGSLQPGDVGYGVFAPPTAAPMTAPPAAGARSMVLAPSQTNQINVYAAPGQSPADIGAEIDRRIAASWDANLEAAGAAAPQ